MILLMEEILHHLGCIKTLVNIKDGIKYHQQLLKNPTYPRNFTHFHQFLQELVHCLVFATCLLQRILVERWNSDLHEHFERRKVCGRFIWWWLVGFDGEGWLKLLSCFSFQKMCEVMYGKNIIYIYIYIFLI